MKRPIVSRARASIYCQWKLLVDGWPNLSYAVGDRPIEGKFEMPSKLELTEKLTEFQHLVLRMDTVLADLRYRNADLRNKMEEMDPEVAEELSPGSIPDRRFNKIWRLTQLCIKLSKSTTDSYLDIVGEIITQAEDIQNYYATYYASEEKKQLTPEHIAAMQAGRRAKREDISL